MPDADTWSPEDVERALSELRHRHPTLSAHLFRILLKTAQQQVAPPDLNALIECVDKIIKALKDGK